MGARIDDRLRERAIALLMAGNTGTYVAKTLGIPVRTVYDWRESMNQDELAAVRNKMREKFLREAWDIVSCGNRVILRRLERAADAEAEIDDAIAAILDSDASPDDQIAAIKKLGAVRCDDINKVASTVGIIYDKQALENRKPTTIVGGEVTIKKFEDL